MIGPERDTPVAVERDGNYYYSLASDGKSYELRGGTGVNGDTVTLPSSHRGLPVIAFRTRQPGDPPYLADDGDFLNGERVCWQNSSVRRLVVLEGYSALDAGCLLGLGGTEELVLPSGLTKIPDEAFRGVPLTAVSFPVGLTKIGALAFSDTALLCRAAVFAAFGR